MIPLSLTTVSVWPSGGVYVKQASDVQIHLSLNVHCPLKEHWYDVVWSTSEGEKNREQVLKMRFGKAEPQM